MHIIYNREKNRIEFESTPNAGGLSFLYSTLPGRAITNSILCRHIISSIYGRYIKSHKSVSRISEFIQQYNINVSEIKEPIDSFPCFNDFFIRELKADARPTDREPGHLISPADSRLLVFDLHDKKSLPIKGYWYSLPELLRDGSLASEYVNGWCYVYRLSPADYHRYCYIDSGYQDEVRTIPGVLNSVNPIALSSVKSLIARNYRELTILHTNNFNKVLQLEIGALLVGKIIQHYRGSYNFRKGEEKGWFEFGGSTIVQLFKKEVVKPDPDLLECTANHIETLVKMGERVGYIL